MLHSHHGANAHYIQHTLQALYSKFLRTLDNFEDAVPELAAFLNNHNEITLQLFLYDVKAARCCSPLLLGLQVSSRMTLTFLRG